MPNLEGTRYNPNAFREARNRAVRTLAMYAGVALLSLTLACGPSGIDATSSASSTSVSLYTGSESVLVVSGDTYTKIGDRCDVPTDVVQEMNSDAPLFAGKIISVPTPNNCINADEIRGAMNEKCTFTPITVDYDDNLNSVANAVDQDVALVGLATGLKTNDPLNPGQVLNVPVSCEVATK